MTFQQTIIIGNVGRDPEFKYTPQGTAVCTFSVAVNKVTGSGENRKEKTTWFRVTVWEKRAETASQYIKKGMKLMVIGEVDASAYLNKQTNQPVASLELTARDFKFLDSRQEGQGGDYQSAPSAGGYTEEDSGDLPF
jgi:single-strand DNA-binding protein